MINKELKLKYIKSLKSGGKVPKYQTAWGKLDRKDKLDDWTKHWLYRATDPSAESKIIGGWKPGSRNGHVESDEEYTARRIKEEQDAAKKRTKHIKKAADTAHMIGTLGTGIGTIGLLLTNPVTTLSTIAGGVAGEKAVDYGLGKLADRTGSKVRSWKDLTDKYLGWSPTLQTLSNPGIILGGGIGAKAGSLPSKYYIKPGYLNSGINPKGIGKVPEMPEGYTFVREVTLNGKLKHMVKDPNGKFKVLEDLDLNNVQQQQPKVNLRNYHGEKLTGNESGFDEWARTRIPENDHFPDLSHGIKDIRDLLPLMNQEFESLPNGSRVDLGHIFSSDSSSNLLQFIRRNNKRIKVVLPENYDEMVVTNDHGTRGADSERIFNEQLEKILDLYGYSPDAVPKAVYDPNTNTLSVPKLSFMKLYKKGNKIKWN